MDEKKTIRYVSDGRTTDITIDHTNDMVMLESLFDGETSLITVSKNELMTAMKFFELETISDRKRQGIA